MAVRREIEDRADRDVSIGAVYATLDRLEEKGLVKSRLGDAVGRAWRPGQEMLYDYRRRRQGPRAIAAGGATDARRACRRGGIRADDHLRV